MAQASPHDAPGDRRRLDDLLSGRSAAKKKENFCVRRIRVGMSQAIEASDDLCPVCGGAGKFQDRLRGAETRSRLAAVFGAPPPDSIEIRDYTLQGCESCGLVFSNPMQPGDHDFYAWITSFPRYHAKHRWEWRAIRSILGKDTRPIRLLEVGCGSGAFLEFIARLDHVTAVGIDHSAQSVQTARDRGATAHASSVEALRRNHPEIDLFDVIVATHLLEHMADPRGFVEQCVTHLAVGGHLLISTPYSPLSRELLCNDVMNLPPHHMTRWNARAYRNLAKATNLKIEMIAPRAKPAIKRALRQTCIRVAGEDRHFPLIERATILACNLGIFFETLSMTRARERVNGRPSPDKILIKLTRQS
jgi:SAM-dependent methyltransferase